VFKGSPEAKSPPESGKLSPLKPHHFHPEAAEEYAQATVFPYAVVYIDQPERIWIVAVMNCKRRPGYWKERLG
jgi:hypothetical protein